MTNNMKVEYLIFAKINVTVINIGKTKIEELNQDFENLTQIVKHNSFRDSKEIEQYIIKIKTILNMIIKDTKNSKSDLYSNNYYLSYDKNPYFNSLDTALFFLKYLKENILGKIDINIDIYNEYNKDINSLILDFEPSEREIYDIKLYEWLYLYKYIYNNINYGLFKKEELDEFYEKNHRDIINFVLTNNINELNPYQHVKLIQSYYVLSNRLS